MPNNHQNAIAKERKRALETEKEKLLRQGLDKAGKVSKRASETFEEMAQRGLRYLVRVCVCVCVCVCLCVCLSAPFRPLRVKLSPENDTNASSRQDKEYKWRFS